MKKWILPSLFALSLPVMTMAANENCVACGMPSILPLSILTKLPGTQIPLSEVPVPKYDSSNVAGLVSPTRHGVELGKSMLEAPHRGDDFSGSAAAAPVKGAVAKIEGAFDFATVNPAFQSNYWNLKPTSVPEVLEHWNGSPFTPGFQVRSNVGWHSQLWEPSPVQARPMFAPRLSPFMAL